jgi:recombination protein RecA
MEDKQLTAIRKKLGHVSLAWRPKFWLDTKIPGLNQVIGHRDKGVPYGRVMEVFGWSGQGKSSFVLSLAAMMQKDGAYVVLGDLENSFEEDYGRARGLDLNRMMLIQPYVLKADKRLTYAQELCAEIEEAIKLKTQGDRKVVILDSITAMLTEGEAESGLDGGIKARLDLPVFLGKLLRRWVGLAQVHNVLLILVNQMRSAPRAFGDYTPGGNAPVFFSHVRVQVKRVKGSRIMEKGQVVGIKGRLVCVKNKTGGAEGSEIGFKLRFKGGLEFVPVRSLQEEE